MLCNRSAALLKLNKHAKALADAETCAEQHPEFAKGHYRVGQALEAMGGRADEAAEAFRRAIGLDASLGDPQVSAKISDDPLKFAQSVMELVQSAEGQVEAAAYFSQMRESLVGIEEAWSDQEHLLQGTGFLRERVISLQSPFMVLVVPRSAIHFPQVAVRFRC